jgi:predicted DNA-binding helix-hairpin-helix protein
MMILENGVGGTNMDRREKLKLLTRAAQYDLCSPACPSSGTRIAEPCASYAGQDISQWLFPAVLPNGKHLPLLKVLQSNMCDNNCLYCAMRRGRDGERCAFSSDELAAAFDQLAQRGVAQGLFLSSAVCDNADRTMDRMIATVELVRFKYHFAGYVHLKLLPGCDQAAIERAIQLADRVSVNLEAPTPTHLACLSGDKRFEQDLMQPMCRARRLLDQSERQTPDITTQFVVGAAGESDLEILSTAEHLHHNLGVTRAYFSAFRPVPGTPLENLPPTPAWRQNRLYQGDYLLRFYGFSVQDLTFNHEGNLRADLDPKMAWAQRHPEMFPIEINHATREELLRVPGIGPRSARRIVHLRRQGKFRDLRDLRAVGAVADRAAPFVLLDGHRTPQQLSLFARAPTAYYQAG